MQHKPSDLVGIPMMVCSVCNHRWQDATDYCPACFARVFDDEKSHQDHIQDIAESNSDDEAMAWYYDSLAE
jgi:predicted amidophosphoribosyltransferase